jgi:hypothetical protein
MQLSKLIIRNTLVVIILCLTGGIVVNAQTDQGAEDWARTQMTSTVAGGTGLFNTFSPRILRRGELTFGLFYNNVKRDPGALDINTSPANITVGLGHHLEGFINMNFFQQVTSRQPFLLSGPAFSTPRLLGLPTEQFFGPPVAGSGGGAAFWPGSFSPRGGILPALGSPLAPGTFVVKVPLPGYYNDYPFAPGLRFLDPNLPQNDQFQNSSNRPGNISVGAKFNIWDPDHGRYGLALIGQISFPTARNFSALSKGAGTGEMDYGLTLAASAEYLDHRLRLMGNFGFLKKGDPERNGVKLLDIANELNVNGGLGYALTRHIEWVTELTGTFFIGGATPDYNRVAPVDYQTGARFHFRESRVSFGGAFRINLTRADLHSNIPGLIFVPTPAPNGVFVPTVFNFASEGVSSFVAFASFGLRKPEGPPPAPPAPKEDLPPVVNCSVSPDSFTKGSGGTVATITSQARDPENDIVTYSWSASGGATVSGSGAQVTVDTANLAPGSYTVTETVSDAHGHSTTCNTTINVREKPNNCPTVSLSVDPRTVEAGTNTRVTFHATGSDADGDPLTYTWNTSSGTLSGSGDTVTLDTSGMPGGEVRVSVSVSDGKCQGSDSATLTITAKPVPPSATQLSSCNTYKRLNDTRPDNTCKGFLDDAAARLQQDPRAVLVVQGYSQDKEKANIAQQRAERVRDYLVSKGIDSSRIKVQSKGNVPAPGAAADNNKVVAIWLVPEGASEPQEE